jgi:hypothetical protein
MLCLSAISFMLNVQIFKMWNKSQNLLFSHEQLVGGTSSLNIIDSWASDNVGAWIFSYFLELKIFGFKKNRCRC